ncbi:MAG TPA: tetratricopeptide repeat protein, partial [Anaerolineales bacterium]
AELLVAAPGLNFLVTSRERLRLSGERHYPVSPLAAPPVGLLAGGLALEEVARFSAVELFCKRARAALPDFDLSVANAAAVGEICGRLDGLPLAIELAAARLPFFGTPAALLARLGNGFKLLRSGARDLPARQHTLQATIQWSHTLLKPEEQRLFRRLAVFAGGCTLETAEAVCNRKGDLGIDLLDGMEALLEKSLLRREVESGDEPRFEMLRTIQDFAQEQLQASAEEEQVRRYHAEYFLALAEDAEPRLTGPDQARGMQLLETEHNNLRVALAWSRDSNQPDLSMRLAAALAWFWNVRGHYSEGRRQLEEAISRSQEALDLRLRVRALCGVGSLAIEQGEYQAARVPLERGLELARQAGDLNGKVRIFESLGNLAAQQGEHTEARVHLKQSLAIAEEIDDRGWIAQALIGLALVAILQDDYAEARACAERGLVIAEEIGYKSGMARALTLLGFVAGSQGELEPARSFLERSLAIAEEIGEKGRMAGTLNGLGNLATDLCDYAAARAYYLRSLAIAEEIGDKGRIATTLHDLGEVFAEQGDYASARAYYEQGLAIAEVIGKKLVAGLAFVNLGDIELNQGNHTAARTQLERGLAVAEEIGDQSIIANGLSNLGQLEHYQGNFSEAQSHLARSLAVAEETGEKRFFPMTLCRLGELELNQGDYAAARSYLERGLAVAGETGHKRWAAIILGHLGELELQQGDRAAARSKLERSLAIVKELMDVATTANVFRKLAALEAEGAAATRAARLWGAAERLREEIGAVIPPIDLERYERRLKRARVQLGEEDFTSAVNGGRALSIDEAITYAFEPSTAKDGEAKPGSSDHLVSLTPREREVLRLVARGMTDIQVAEELVISPRTVNAHLTSIYSKLGVNSRAAATRFAVEKGLV